MSTNQNTLNLCVTGTSQINTTLLMYRFCYALNHSQTDKRDPRPKAFPEMCRMLPYRNSEYKFVVTHAIDLAAVDFSKSPEGAFMILCVTVDTITEAKMWAKANEEALEQWRIIMVLITDEPDHLSCKRVRKAARDLCAVAHGWCSLKAAKDNHIIWIFTLPLHLCWSEDEKKEGHLTTRFRPVIVKGEFLDQAAKVLYNFNQAFKEELESNSSGQKSANQMVQDHPSSAETILRKNLRKSAKNALQVNSPVSSGEARKQSMTAPVTKMKSCNPASACRKFLHLPAAIK